MAVRSWCLPRSVLPKEQMLPQCPPYKWIANPRGREEARQEGRWTRSPAPAWPGGRSGSVVGLKMQPPMLLPPQPPARRWPTLSLCLAGIDLAAEPHQRPEQGLRRARGPPVPGSGGLELQVS